MCLGIVMIFLTIMANLIRLKSILHAYVLAEEKRYHWLHSNRSWVTSSSPKLLIYTPAVAQVHFNVRERISHHSEYIKNNKGPFWFLIFFLSIIGVSLN